MYSKDLKEKYLGREELYSETQKCIKLNGRFKKFTKKVYGMEFNIFSYCEIFGYLNGEGYYVLEDGDNGRIEPTVIKYGLNEEEAFFKILDTFLYGCGANYELDNRKKLVKEFIERYHKYGFKIENGMIDNYLGTIYIAEYCINKWNKYFDGNIPQEVINHYVEYVNDDYRNEMHGVNWWYNSEKKQFECEKRIKVRKKEA